MIHALTLTALTFAALYSFTRFLIGLAMAAKEGRKENKNDNMQN